MSWDTALLLAAAGFVAGLVNGVAGGGSLVSFPALLATGHGALVANVTSTVGIWPGYAGGVAGYRRVLGDQRDRVRRLAPTCALGGLAGAALLLLPPSQVFATIAPYLILAACALFAVQPRLSRALARRTARRDTPTNGAPVTTTGPHRGSTFGLHTCVLLAAMYGAYFGAGLGVILLAVLA